MKVLFMGTPAFAAVSLKRILDAGHDIVAVVTRADAPAGRGLRTRTSAVKDLAAGRGLRVLQPRTLRPPAGADVLRECAALAPEIVVVVAYGRLLPPEMISLAPHGAVNVHASLLPAYRGAAPIAWAIARGERETGVTTMRMTDELDAGDILLQEAIPIHDDETTGALETRLAELGGDLLVTTIERIATGRIAAASQDPGQVSWAPRITRQDGRIDWGMDCREIERRVRAFDPWPVAWTTTAAGRLLRVLKARPVERASGGASPGTVQAVRGAAAGSAPGVEVACGRGALLMMEVQPEGRRRMRADEAASGRHLAEGDRLGAPS